METCSWSSTGLQQQKKKQQPSHTMGVVMATLVLRQVNERTFDIASNEGNNWEIPSCLTDTRFYLFSISGFFFLDCRIQHILWKLLRKQSLDNCLSFLQPLFKIHILLWKKAISLYTARANQRASPSHTSIQPPLFPVVTLLPVWVPVSLVSQ